MLFFPNNAAIFSHIVIAVGIYFYITTIGSHQQVEDMITIELGYPTPVLATNAAALQLSVVIRVDAIDIRLDSDLISHGIKV